MLNFFNVKKLLVVNTSNFFKTSISIFHLMLNVAIKNFSLKAQIILVFLYLWSYATKVISNYASFLVIFGLFIIAFTAHVLFYEFLYILWVIQCITIHIHTHTHTRLCWKAFNPIHFSKSDQIIKHQNLSFFSIFSW